MLAPAEPSLAVVATEGAVRLLEKKVNLATAQKLTFKDIYWHKCSNSQEKIPPPSSKRADAPDGKSLYEDIKHFSILQKMSKET